MNRPALWISVLVAAVTVAIAAPMLAPPRDEHGNETAAIATLRNLASTQSWFQGSRQCDLDGDGIGEFGTFGEMTATEGIRADAGGGARGPVLHPSVLSVALASVDSSGIVTKSGYCLRIFLPGAKAGAVHERKGQSLSGPVDVDATEKRWCAYAWPVAHGQTGNHAYFTDQGGVVWWTENKGRPNQGEGGLGPYQGVYAQLDWDAAMPAEGRPGWSSTPDPMPHVGRDGNEWKPVN